MNVQHFPTYNWEQPSIDFGSDDGNNNNKSNNSNNNGDSGSDVDPFRVGSFGINMTSDLENRVEALVNGGGK